MILILGGARSGKSRLALDFAKKKCRRVAFVATMPVCDEEMKKRINLHKAARPKNWITIEAQKTLVPSLKKIPAGADGVLIECVGTYVSNLMMNGLSDSKIIDDISNTLKYLRRSDREVFIVSNEVGSGVVPATALGRRFRDIVGTINQVIARAADEVYFVIAGLPLKLK